jgi:hypothetical protein
MKTKILKAITYVAFLINMTAICCLDSTGWVFWAVVAAWVLSGAWLLLFAWANGWVGTTDGRF